MKTIAREIIDCTGDSDVVRALGLKVMYDEVRQPGVLQYKTEAGQLCKTPRPLSYLHITFNKAWRFSVSITFRARFSAWGRSSGFSTLSPYPPAA